MNFERKYALNESKKELVFAEDYIINIKPNFYCIDCKKKLEHVNEHKRKSRLVKAHFRSDPHVNYCSCKEKGIQYEFYDDIYNDVKDYHLDMIKQIDENYKLKFIYFRKCIYDIKNKNNEYIVIRDSLLNKESIKIYDSDNIIVKFLLNFENRKFDLSKIKDKYFITFKTKNDITYFNKIENVYIDTRKSMIIKLNNKQIKYNNRIYWLVDIINYKDLFNVMFKDIITIKDRNEYDIKNIANLIKYDIDIHSLLLNDIIELDKIIENIKEEEIRKAADKEREKIEKIKKRIEEEERKKIYSIKYFQIKNNYPIILKYTEDEYNNIKNNLDINNHIKIEIYKYNKNIDIIINENYKEILEKEKHDLEEYEKINKERNEALLEFEQKYNQRFKNNIK
jgi:hypothetical protein